MEVRTDARGLQLRSNGDPFHHRDLEALYDILMMDDRIAHPR